MPFHQSGYIRYYTAKCLDDAGVTHAIFTRQGGISPEPWASLNLGGTVGDDPNRVRVNREIAFSSMNLDLGTVFDVWQVHSSNIVYAKEPRHQQDPHPQADAIITDKLNVTLFMRFADCVPILLFDPIQRIVGIVHSGWPGTVKKIARDVVAVFTNKFNSKPSDLFAAIGPSICVDHYEIGPDVEAQVRSAFQEDTKDILFSVNAKVHFNLWAANRIILEKCGVQHIEVAGLCTACHPEDWYSHRGERGKTGRFGALIRLTR